MHIYANSLLHGAVRLRGRRGTGRLPVIDLIASCDQGAFGDFLKGYQNDQRQTELVCTKVKLDGQEFQARISLPPPPTTANPASRW